jgi:hypothetical protein
VCFVSQTFDGYFIYSLIHSDFFFLSSCLIPNVRCLSGRKKIRVHKKSELCIPLIHDILIYYWFDRLDFFIRSFWQQTWAWAKRSFFMGLSDGGWNLFIFYNDCIQVNGTCIGCWNGIMVILGSFYSNRNMGIGVGFLFVNKWLIVIRVTTKYVTIFINSVLIFWKILK